MKKILKKPITLDGFLTMRTDNYRRSIDFICCEDVEMKGFTAYCKVQMMRDGNVYVNELPRRIRNRALFREDNCSLSHGQNGRYYFVFSLDDKFVNQLPERLVQQASAIAQKVIRELIYKETSR